MQVEPDVLVAGAGPVGCVVAERCASAGLRVLVLDRRLHVAGNCHDARRDGVLVHQYGPHYFRTGSAALLAYLSRFTAWLPGRYYVRASYRGELYPLPVCRRTLEQFFGVQLHTDADAEAVLAAVRVPIAEPVNAEEYALSRVGRDLYRAFIEGYTYKQWGIHPSKLEPWLLGRLPVRTGTDERYVDARHQCMPAAGYTAMFSAMLAHPLVEVVLGVDYHEARAHLRPRVGTVYTGALDEYFDHQLGPLPWRSLRFEWATHEAEYRLPCVQVNYPGLHVRFTRQVEAKHVTGQRSQNTVVCTEYPSATGEPYYPVPEASARQLAGQYAAMAAAERQRARVWFAGRLAEYQYMTTDGALLRGLAVATEVTSTAQRDREAGLGALD